MHRKLLLLEIQLLLVSIYLVLPCHMIVRVYEYRVYTVQVGTSAAWVGLHSVKTMGQKHNHTLYVYLQVYRRPYIMMDRKFWTAE